MGHFGGWNIFPGGAVLCHGRRSPGYGRPELPGDIRTIDLTGDAGAGCWPRPTISAATSWITLQWRASKGGGRSRTRPTPTPAALRPPCSALRKRAETVERCPGRIAPAGRWSALFWRSYDLDGSNAFAGENRECAVAGVGGDRTVACF